jgi:hypothetical protein
MSVNYAALRDRIRNKNQGGIIQVKFSKRKIVLEYADGSYELTFSYDCCETSWFEIPRLESMISNGIVLDSNYVQLDNLSGEIIQQIGSECVSIDMEHSGLQDWDKNDLYKIVLENHKYSYLLLRCSSNGYYSTYLQTKKIPKQKIISSVSSIPNPILKQISNPNPNLNPNPNPNQVSKPNKKKW